jgi:hypothetical protein
MDNHEVRQAKIIKEDIEDINELIKVNSELLEEYSDDFSLIHNMEFLKSKLDELLMEFDIANSNSMIKTFDIVFGGEPIRGTSIPLAFFGDALSTYQKMIDSIVQKDVSKETSRGPISLEIKAMSQLNAEMTTAGSFRVIVSANPAFDTPPSIQALNKVNDLLECQDDLEKIKGMRKIVGARVIKNYKDFIHVLSSNKADLAFYDKCGTKMFSTMKISKELSNNIYRIIKEVEELPEQIESFQGKFNMIDVEKRKFRFELLDHKQIHGLFHDDLEQKMRKSNFDDEISATFKHTVSYNEATDEETEEWELIKLK